MYIFYEKIYSHKIVNLFTYLLNKIEKLKVKILFL